MAGDDWRAQRPSYERPLMVLFMSLMLIGIVLVVMSALEGSEDCEEAVCIGSWASLGAVVNLG